MATPLDPHQSQSSLQDIIELCTEPGAEASFDDAQRANAKRRFYSIVDHFDATGGGSVKTYDYNHPQPIRLPYEYSLSEESQDRFLVAFFRAIAPLALDGDEDPDFEELRPSFFAFADYLVDNYFLPLKAAGQKTPQPSPAYHSAVQGAQGEEHTFIGTPGRLSALRGTCLIRDRDRCVISRKFDIDEAEKRVKNDDDDARDDDGALLRGVEMSFAMLDIAHIIPHYLTSSQAALTILNLFDMGVAHLIEGSAIDQPSNAMTLTKDLHHWFGAFRIYFTPLPGTEHTYTIDSFLPPYIFRDPSLPIDRTLYITPNRTIDPPSPRLLAIHRAIAHILHLSAAGEYIDRLLRDMEESNIRADGSTELDRLVKLKLLVG